MDQLFIILANDREEDGPHYFREVHIPLMISYVQTENDLIQLDLIDVNGFVSERWW